MPLSKLYAYSVSDKFKVKQPNPTLADALRRSIEELPEQARIEAEDLMPKEKDFLPQQVALELEKIELTKLTAADLHQVGHFYYLNVIRIIKLLEDLKTLIERVGEPYMSDTNNFAYYAVYDGKTVGYKVDCATSLARAKEGLGAGGRDEAKGDEGYNTPSLIKLQKEYDTLTGFIDRCHPDFLIESEQEQKQSSHRMMAEVFGIRAGSSSQRLDESKKAEADDDIADSRTRSRPLRKSAKSARNGFKKLENYIDSSDLDIEPDGTKSKAKRGKRQRDTSPANFEKTLTKKPRTRSSPRNGMFGLKPVAVPQSERKAQDVGKLLPVPRMGFDKR